VAPISLLGDDLVRLACAGRSVAEEPLLVIPVQRQFDLAGEPRGAEVDGLLAVKNRFDNSGGQEGEADQPPDIPIGDTLAGMVRNQLLEKDGTGAQVRYRVASAPPAPPAPPAAPAPARRTTRKAQRV